MSNKKPLLLIDGDILLFQAIAGVEQEIEFDEDMWAMFTDLRDAQANFKEALANITEVLPYHEPYLCITGFGNFRKDLDPSYKGHRKKTRKPMGFKPFRQWVIDNYPNLCKDGIEADDAMGILATKPGNEEAVIWSIDKDLRQIPGKHLYPDGEVNTVYPDQGDYLHFLQTLTGDTADGYKGCPGMGPKKAEAAFRPFISPAGLGIDGKIDRVGMWGAILFAYEQAALTPEDALLQARLARILRWDEWDSKKQEPKLWEPPTDE